MKNQKIVRLVILIPLILIFAAIIFRIDMVQLWVYFARVIWEWAVFVLFLNLFLTFIEALRWKLIVSCVKKETSITSTFSAILAGFVGNMFMPMRLGDVLRAYFLSQKEGISLTSSLSTVILDYYLNTVVFVILITMSFFMFPIPLSIKHPVFLTVLLVSVGATLLIMVFPFNRNIKYKIKKMLGERISGRIFLFKKGLSALNDGGILITTSLLTVIIWGLKVLMVWSMIKSFRLDLPVKASFAVVILSNIGIALVNSPANLGSFELSIVASLKLFDVDIKQALSFAVLLHIIEVIPVMILGFLVFGFRQITTQQLFNRKALTFILKQMQNNRTLIHSDKKNGG
jgi:hypothetical protein